MDTQPTTPFTNDNASSVGQPPVGQPDFTVQPSQPQPVAPPTMPADQSSAQVYGMQGQPIAPGAPATAVVSKSPRRKLKLALITLLGVVVLAGGTVGAYFGVIVPNKPENVLKSALQNSLTASGGTTSVLFEGQSNDGPAFKADIVAKTNAQSKAFGLDAKVTISGVSIAAEARYVDKNAYLKVKDLDKLGDLVSSFTDDQTGKMVTSLSGKVSDKWFEIDSTILKTAGIDCVLDADNSISKTDVDALQKLYEAQPFVTITNTSNDTVNGKASIKYQLKVDNKKAA